MDAIKCQYYDGKLPTGTAEDLCRRAENLLLELQQYQQALNDRGKSHESEVRVFRRGVESELKSLKTTRDRQAKRLVDEAADDDNDDQHQLKYLHSVNSSNLPFYEAVWWTAKSCSNIIGLGRRVHSVSNPAKSQHEPVRNDRKRGATIDIVAENGLKWIKVSTINNKRLLFEMAKQGWENYGGYSSDEDENHHATDAPAPDERSNYQIDLVQTADILLKAARVHRVHFKHPSVHFVLPNVLEGEYDDVDALLQDLKVMGVDISCGQLSGETAAPFAAKTSLDTATLEALLPNSQSILDFSQVLNIDCTILLALISDISHVAQKDLPPQPINRSGPYHKAILRQIEGEKTQPLLPTEIYPVLVGKELEATAPAAERMFTIVNTMGTDSEKSRANIFFGQGIHSNTPANQLRKELQRQSCHAIPETLNIPIKVIDFTDLSTCQTQPSNLQTLDISIDQPAIHRPSTMSKLDADIAHQLTGKVTLSKINTSVFLYGWWTNVVTLTSNKVVATSIHKAVDEMLDEYERHQSAGHAAEHSGNLRLSSQDSARETETEREKSPPPIPSHQIIDPNRETTFVGPKTYVFETARSLIGKEMQLLS